MDRKGSAMVEATIILPFIVLCIMTIIAILMFIFEEAAASANLHQAIRTESGELTGTFHGNAGSSNVELHRGFRGIYPVLNGKTTAIFEGAWILPKPMQKTFYGNGYLTDERKYARYIDFFSLEDDTDEDQTEPSGQ